MRLNLNLIHKQWFVPCQQRVVCFSHELIPFCTKFLKKKPISTNHKIYNVLELFYETYLIDFTEELQGQERGFSVSFNRLCRAMYYGKQWLRHVGFRSIKQLLIATSILQSWTVEQRPTHHTSQTVDRTEGQEQLKDLKIRNRVILQPFSRISAKLSCMEQFTRTEYL